MSKSNWLGHTASEVNIAKTVDNLLQSRLQENKVCVTDSNSNIKSAAISVSELGHLSGIGSNIQQQFSGLPEIYQPIIGAGALEIAYTSGLQTELNKLTTFSTSRDGFVPQSDSNTTKYLRGDATWGIPQNDDTTISTFALADDAETGKPTLTITDSANASVSVDVSSLEPPVFGTAETTDAQGVSVGYDSGLVPQSTESETSMFLLGNGTWAVPANDNTEYGVFGSNTVDLDDGSQTITSGLVPGRTVTAFTSRTAQYLRADGQWQTPDYTTNAVMGADGVYTAGLVPAGAVGGTGFLKQDGSWGTPTNTQYDVMGADDVYDAGLVPAGAVGGTGFLKQDGSWGAPTNDDTTNSSFSLSNDDYGNPTLTITDSGSQTVSVDVSSLVSTVFGETSGDYVTTGSVPQSHTTDDAGKYLRSDGTWVNPIETYSPSVSETTEVPTDVGGISSGTTALSLTGKSFSELFDMLLFPVQYPVRTDASVSLTLSPSTTYYEVGSSISIAFNTAANDGQIRLNGVVQRNNWVGNLSSAGLSGTLSGTQTLSFADTETIYNGSVSNYSVVLGANTATLTATWSQGPMPLDSTGASYESIRSSDGYYKQASKTIYGVYPIKVGNSSGGFDNHTLIAHNSNNIEIAQDYPESETLKHRINVPNEMLNGRDVRIYGFSESAQTYVNPSTYMWTSYEETVNGVDYTLYTKTDSTGGANDYKLVFS